MRSSKHRAKSPSTMGPRPLITSNSTPRAGSGVKMSENTITASMPYFLQHCSDNSVAMAGVSDLWRKGYLSEYCRNAFMYLPACRMSHTGVRLHPGSPRATRSRRSLGPGVERRGPTPPESVAAPPQWRPASRARVPLRARMANPRPKPAAASTAVAPPPRTPAVRASSCGSRRALRCRSRCTELPARPPALRCPMAAKPAAPAAAAGASLRHGTGLGGCIPQGPAAKGSPPSLALGHERPA
mmetsp:Transcript_116241/g.323755  ORF Transcript_116241/g.323755 Transcript_116241/m.323755 type:complete len:242 (-) Transcript_116241:11-736(-)